MSPGRQVPGKDLLLCLPGFWSGSGSGPVLWLEGSSGSRRPCVFSAEKSPNQPDHRPPPGPAPCLHSDLAAPCQGAPGCGLLGGGMGTSTPGTQGGSLGKGAPPPPPPGRRGGTNEWIILLDYFVDRGAPMKLGTEFLKPVAAGWSVQLTRPQTLPRVRGCSALLSPEAKWAAGGSDRCVASSSFGDTVRQGGCLLTPGRVSTCRRTGTEMGWEGRAASGKANQERTFHTSPF